MTDAFRAVLRPFDRREAMTLKEAAEITGRNPETIKIWCARENIGRMVVGRWFVSRIALAAYLDDDLEAVAAYLDGVRDGPVLPYVQRAGLAPC